jgi:hypothetical protein
LAAFFLRVSDSGIRPPSIIGEEDLMPAKRELTMRQLRQMLRLHHDGVSAPEIGRTLGVARSTILDNLGRAQAAGMSWPLPVEWTDEIIQQRLFGRSDVKPGRRRHSEPNWAALARELKRPGVNLMVLWESTARPIRMAMATRASAIFIGSSSGGCPR